MSPTQRTLAELRKAGYIAAITEHWNPHAFRRIDLLGFIDVLGIGQSETLAVQSTVVASQAAHVDKLTNDCPHVRFWLMDPHRSLEVWAWGKRLKKRGGKAMGWFLTRTRFAVTDDGRIVSAKLRADDDPAPSVNPGAAGGLLPGIEGER